MKIMRTKKFAAWAVAAMVCLAGTFTSGIVAAADSTEASSAPQKLDNASCLVCHDGKKGKLEKTGANGAKLALAPIAPEKFGKGVHSALQCVSCHKDITDTATPHKTDVAQKPDCVQCHLSMWETAKKDNLTQEKARLGIVVQNIEAYKKSLHAKPSAEDKSRPSATCNDCHDVHTFNVPPRGTSKRADEWHKIVPNVCGDKCHSGELDQYNGSVHGKALREKNNLKAAVCIDCHTSHAIGSTSAGPVKMTLTEKCGGCHEENMKTYRDTYHGQVNSLGSAATAKCYDCHGSHDIQKTEDPTSMVNPKNRLQTCKQCHDSKKPGMIDATAGFTSFSPHANTYDFKKYPQMWLTSKFMIVLLVGVFAFFWLHSGLWYFRELKHRKEQGSFPHIRVGDLPADEKYFRRFPVGWRIAHLVFAISLMTLVLTGMTALFAQSSWAPIVSNLLGGAKSMGIIHRVMAVFFVGVFVIHVIYIAQHLLRSKTFRIFGPDSLVPNWKDLADIIGMFKWFLDKGPRPQFDRWTYYEKFDYWAPFWGVTIIGASGLMLAYPGVTATYLPGWVFNVATVIHGEEAFLAAVFLFTVHFFNNHFRPDKLPPPDIVMFTGLCPLDEFRREHPAQYQRLVDTGEIEKYLEDAPSAPMTLGSKILGISLLAIGLGMLILVAIGFFGGHGG
jgi:cytochrome b subunit of formate dehydrogenase